MTLTPDPASQSRGPSHSVDTASAHSATAPISTAPTDRATSESATTQDAPAAQARKRGRRVQAVDHAIDVLAALAEAPQGLTLSAIAQKVSLSKATVYHLLATLETRRIVARDPVMPHYRLGWGLYEFGAVVVRSVDLTRAARHFLDHLAAVTGESVLLGILDHDSVLYLDRGDSPNGFRMLANAGRRSPLHSTASGKILMAFAADPDLFDRVFAGPLEKLTPTTITDTNQLRRELALVRQQRFATCWQEREVGLSSVAVPIYDYTGTVVASLTVAAPATRLNSRTVQQSLVPLRQAAQAIGAQLGHPSHDD